LHLFVVVGMVNEANVRKVTRILCSQAELH